MSHLKFNPRTAILLLFILIVTAYRLFITFNSDVSSFANFTPIGAVALFGGAYFTNKFKAVLVPILALFIGDVFINYNFYHKVVLFYNGAFWVYLSFVLMALIGTFIKKVNVQNVVLASLASVLVHWLISDISPCVSGLYPQTFDGYIQCLIMAIPYEKTMLMGNLVFGLIMFGGFELAKTKFPVLSVKTHQLS
jgi:hypothetical protein